MNNDELEPIKPIIIDKPIDPEKLKHLVDNSIYAGERIWYVRQRKDSNYQFELINGEEQQKVITVLTKEEIKRIANFLYNLIEE
jgi:hypothetical protein